MPETAVKTKVWLERDGHFVIGDGGLRLLLGILEHGSLLALRVRSAGPIATPGGTCGARRRHSAHPLTEPRPGKGASRGTVLTETGRLVIERLAEIRNRIDDAVGPFGPTAADVASRGRRVASDARSAGARAPAPRPSRYRDGDWRRPS